MRSGARSAGRSVRRQPDVTPGALVEWLRPRISGYKVPRQVHFWDALPKTTNDKIDKKRIAELLSEA